MPDHVNRFVWVKQMVKLSELDRNVIRVPVARDTFVCHGLDQPIHHPGSSGSFWMPGQILLADD